jgi:hypothetical protein
MDQRIGTGEREGEAVAAGQGEGCPLGTDSGKTLD